MPVDFGQRMIRGQVRRAEYETGLEESRARLEQAQWARQRADMADATKRLQAFMGYEDDVAFRLGLTEEGEADFLSDINESRAILGIAPQKELAPTVRAAIIKDIDDDCSWAKGLDPEMSEEEQRAAIAARFRHREMLYGLPLHDFMRDMSHAAEIKGEAALEEAPATGKPAEAPAGEEVVGAVAPAVPSQEVGSSAEMYAGILAGHLPKPGVPLTPTEARARFDTVWLPALENVLASPEASEDVQTEMLLDTFHKARRHGIVTSLEELVALMYEPAAPEEAATTIAGEVAALGLTEQAAVTEFQSRMTEAGLAIDPREAATLYGLFGFAPAAERAEAGLTLEGRRADIAAFGAETSRLNALKPPAAEGPPKPPTPARVGVLQKGESWYAELRRPAPKDMPWTLTSFNPETGETIVMRTGLMLREGESGYDLMTPEEQAIADARIQFVSSELQRAQVAGVGPGPTLLRPPPPAAAGKTPEELKDVPLADAGDADLSDWIHANGPSQFVAQARALRQNDDAIAEALREAGVVNVDSFLGRERKPQSKSAPPTQGPLGAGRLSPPPAV